MDNNNSKPRGFGNKSLIQTVVEDGKKYIIDPLENDIPSPVSLDYPYRNLSAIVGGIPGAMDVDETKKQINNFYNSNYNTSDPTTAYNRLENLINRSYITDLMRDYPKTHKLEPDDDITSLNRAKDVILNSPGVSKDLKNKIGIYEEDFGNDRSKDAYYNPWTRNIVMGNGSGPIFLHEVGHAQDSLYGGILDNLINYRDQLVEGVHSGVPFDPNKKYNDVFEVGDLSGEARHQIPLYLNNKEENAELLKPFLIAGMQADKTPRPTWDKIKRLFTGPK
jgi:hypothetical protein